MTSVPWAKLVCPPNVLHQSVCWRLCPICRRGWPHIELSTLTNELDVPPCDDCWHGIGVSVASLAVVR